MFCGAVKNMVSRPALLSWRHFLRTQTKHVKFSSSVAPTTVVVNPEEPTDRSNVRTASRSKSMVAAAFESLNEPDTLDMKDIKFPSLDDRISAAESVDALLSVADASHVTKKHALKIVSVLADWSTENKAKLIDFEADVRFHKLCRMLGRNYKDTGKDSKAEGVNNSEDLATVLEVTGDDEAAKLVGTISFQQMIKVMSTLAQKKRRSTPLLRSLAYNLCRDPQQLNVKQSADLLFSMAVLNFPDGNLLDKVRNDLSESLPTNQKAAPVGSILTSLGLLRHKDPALLDTVTEWVGRNLHECRPQDLVSFLLTLAHVGYTPSNADTVFEAVSTRLTSPQDVPTLASWLEVVWSLAVLGRASPQMLATALDSKFYLSLGASLASLPMAAKLKLLNINAVAHLETPTYSGPLLENVETLEATIVRSRSKEHLVQSVLDTLTNLLPSSTYLRSSVNSGMGFLIDGECLIDSKGNPLSLTETQEEVAGKKKKKATRIAMLVWDYPDLCRGMSDPTGPNVLAMRLLQRQGMRVCSIPHTEFNPREKLVQRVQYLEKKIKTLAKEK